MKSVIIAIVMSIVSSSIASADVYGSLKKVAYDNGSNICYDGYSEGSGEYYNCLSEVNKAGKINKMVFDKVMPKYKKKINALQSIDQVKEFPMTVQVVFHCLNDAVYYSYYDERYGSNMSVHDSVDTAVCINDNLGRYVFNK